MAPLGFIDYCGLRPQLTKATYGCKSAFAYLLKLIMVFVYISASSYIYTNYIFLESTYNTDSRIKISAVGNNFEKLKKIEIKK